MSATESPLPSAPSDESSIPRSGDASNGATLEERVRETASDAASGAKRQAESVYRGASSAAAETSAAIDGAADSLASSGHETLSQAAGAISDRVRALSDYLEGRKLEDLIGDARQLAQRNPGLFVVGGVVLGFALSRFLKASDSGTHHRTS